MSRLLGCLLLGAALVGCSESSGPSQETLRNQIVFRALEGGEPRLEVINPDGSGRKPVLSTALPVAPSFPAVAPDGRRLAFNQGSEVWVADYPGSGVRSLTVGHPGAVSGPRWHPNGMTLLVFASGPGSGELELINADTGTRDTLLGDGTENTSPDWSPTGSEVVFVRFPPAAEGALYRMDVASGSITVMFDSLGSESHPRWSPSGERVSFFRPDILSESSAGVWLLDLSSGSLRQVSPTGRCPCPFSPDGEELIYHELEEVALAGLVRYSIQTETRTLVVPGEDRLDAVPQPDWGR